MAAVLVAGLGVSGTLQAGTNYGDALDTHNKELLAAAINTSGVSQPHMGEFAHDATPRVGGAGLVAGVPNAAAVAPNYGDNPTGLDARALLPAWRWSQIPQGQVDDAFSVDNILPVIMNTISNMIFAVADLAWKLLLFIISLSTQVDWLRSSGYVVSDAFLTLAIPAFVVAAVVWVYVLGKAGIAAVRGGKNSPKTLAVLVGFVLPVAFMLTLYNGAVTARDGGHAELAAVQLENGGTCLDNFDDARCNEALRRASIAAENAVGSPIWLATSFQGLFSDFTDIAVGFTLFNNADGVRTGTLRGAASPSDPHCAGYMKAMFQRFNQADTGAGLANQGNSGQTQVARGSDSILNQVSVAWISGLYQPWVNAQFGESDLGRVAGCHIMEETNNVPITRRQSTMAQAYPELAISTGVASAGGGEANYGATGGNVAGHPSIYTNVPGHLKFAENDESNREKNAKESRLRTFNWAACNWNGSSWQLDKDWVGAGDPALGKQDGMDGATAERYFRSGGSEISQYCTKRWVNGHKEIDPTLGNLGPESCTNWLFGAVTFGCEGGIDQQTEDLSVPATQVRSALKDYFGESGSQRLIYSVMALLAAAAYLFMLGGPSVGLLIATVIVIFCLIFLPLILVGAAAGGKKAKSLLRLAVGMTAAKAMFTILVFIIIQVNFVILTVINAGTANVGSAVGSSFVNTALVMLSPLLVMYVMTKLLRQLGWGNLMSLSGALGMVGTMAAKASGANDMAGFLQSGLKNAERKTLARGKDAHKWGKEKWKGGAEGRERKKKEKNASKEERIALSRAKEDKAALDKARAEETDPAKKAELADQSEAKQAEIKALQESQEARKKRRREARITTMATLGAKGIVGGMAAGAALATGAAFPLAGVAVGALAAAATMKTWGAIDAATLDQVRDDTDGLPLPPGTSPREVVDKGTLEVSSQPEDIRYKSAVEEAELKRKLEGKSREEKHQIKYDHFVAAAASLTLETNPQAEKLNDDQLATVRDAYMSEAKLEGVVDASQVAVSHFGHAAVLPTPENMANLVVAAKSGNDTAAEVLANPMFFLPEEVRVQGADETKADYMTRMSIELVSHGLAVNNEAGQIAYVNVPSMYGMQPTDPAFLNLMGATSNGDPAATAQYRGMLVEHPNPTFHVANREVVELASAFDRIGYGSEQLEYRQEEIVRNSHSLSAATEGVADVMNTIENTLGEVRGAVGMADQKAAEAAAAALTARLAVDLPAMFRDIFDVRAQTKAVETYEADPGRGVDVERLEREADEKVAETSQRIQDVISATTASEIQKLAAMLAVVQDVELSDREREVASGYVSNLKAELGKVRKRKERGETLQRSSSLFSRFLNRSKTKKPNKELAPAG